MTGILLDTNAYVAFSKGLLDAVEIISRAQRLVLTTVVLGELKAGFAGGKRQAENLQRLEKFLALPGVETLALDEGTSDFYGSLHATLRSIGRPLPTNDIWIAASALQHGLMLFSFDQHFRIVPGLQVGTMPADFVGAL